jgi:hypothetical protein
MIRFLLSFKFLRYTPFYWWMRLMGHSDFRLDDYHLCCEFWSSLNHEWEHMEYVHKFEEFWGKGSYPPETIVLSERDFDALVERLNEPPDPEVQKRFREILERVAPWD